MDIGLIAMHLITNVPLFKFAQTTVGHKSQVLNTSLIHLHFFFPFQNPDLSKSTLMATIRPLKTGNLARGPLLTTTNLSENGGNNLNLAAGEDPVEILLPPRQLRPRIPL